MAYLWAGATSYVAFVHYDVPLIPYLYHYLLFLQKWTDWLFVIFGVCSKILILWGFQARFLRFFPRFSLTI